MSFVYAQLTSLLRIKLPLNKYFSEINPFPIA